MIDRPFTAVAEPGGAVGVVRMTGNITRGAAATLSSAFREACRIGGSAVALDFDEVEYLNSTGIALIVGLLKEARATGLEVRVWGLSDHFREIFEVTRLVEFMTLYDNETAAVERA